MENNSLATESFSYSWLVADIKPQSYDDSFLRQIFPDEKEQNMFNFDVPVSKSPANLAHADEIFSNGHIKPVFLNRSEEKRDSISVPSSPVFTYAASENRCCEIGKQRRAKGMLLRCFKFVKQRLGCSRKSNRVDDLVRKVCEAHDSSEKSSISGYVIKTDERIDFSSPWLSPSRSCSEAESSIHEAILYCKRSIEK